MAENTKIQWTHHTFNPWIGCTKVSEGCKFCYAEALMDHRYHRVKWGPQGTRSKTKTWKDPLRWNREAAEKGERHKVFCASLADVFEDRPELVSWREELFQLIGRCDSLDWLLLTKRPENITTMWPDSFPRLRENVWLGTSLATQRNADECIDRLVTARELSNTLFLSVEPQIEYIDLNSWLHQIDWVIVGGESKQGKDEPRRFDIRWAADILHECREFSVPCFIKQFGSNAFEGKKRLIFKDHHGGDITEWPQELQVRECPESYAFAH